MEADKLLQVAMAHGRSMMQACATALVGNGECAPMFAVLDPDGHPLAAGLFAAFKDDEEKVSKFRALADFAATQRAAVVVTCFDMYVASYEPLLTVETDGEVAVDIGDQPRPRDRADAREGLYLEIMTALGVMQPSVVVAYSRGDGGVIAFDEPRQETFTAVGEGLASVGRGLATQRQRESRSTAVRRLLQAGFHVLGDEREADEWRRAN